MSKLLQFSASSPKVSVQAKTATHAVMELYGTVGGDFFDEGILAKDVVAQLKELPPSIKTMDLHVNSPGGSVFEGMAIYNRLKQYGQKVKITAHVDALAASIASVIIMAAHEVVMSDSGFIMIHLPWTMAVGNANDLEKTIGLLDDIENQMLSLYAKKTKLDRIEIRDLLTKETWLDAEEAIRLGFADKKRDDEDMRNVKIAACINPNMKWLKQPPKSLTTTDVLAAKAVTDLKSKLEQFLARK